MNQTVIQKAAQILEHEFGPNWLTIAQQVRN